MNIKSILLGAAAAAAAVTGAQAADLPVAPEPVDYVRVCDAFGTGFFYIPGTETCLRVRGRVRAEYRFNDFGSRPNNWTNRMANDTSTRARGYVYLDARTNTEYGLVRAYTEIYVTADSGNGSGNIKLGKAYVQFGNFTVGRAGSFYDFYTGNTFGNLGQQWSDNGDAWVAAYTAGFGNGISATLSVEDGTFRQQGLVSSTGVDGYAGHRIPDIVANLRVDQGWGSAQLMGAIHEVRFAEAAASGQVGWAIGAGVTVNLPMLLQGANVTLQANYADGALKYVSANLPSAAFDGVYNGVKTDTSTAWSVSGGFYLPWTATWSTSLDASYADVDQKLTAPDFSRWGVGANLVWEPVSGLQIGGEVEYRDTNFSSNLISDYDEAMITFRVQRSF